MIKNLIQINESGVVHRLKNNIDIVIVLLFFLYIGSIAASHPPTAQVFPLVFIIVGGVALIIELITDVFLPESYRDKAHKYTQGLSSSIESSFTESYDEEDPRTDLADLPGITRDNAYRIGLIALLIVGYGIVTSLIGFLLTVPLFTFSVVYLVGSKSLPRAIIVSGLLMVFVYLLFGQLMNAPILETQVGWFQW